MVDKPVEKSELVSQPTETSLDVTVDEPVDYVDKSELVRNPTQTCHNVAVDKPVDDVQENKGGGEDDPRYPILISKYKLVI